MFTKPALLAVVSALAASTPSVDLVTIEVPEQVRAGPVRQTPDPLPAVWTVIDPSRNRSSSTHGRRDRPRRTAIGWFVRTRASYCHRDRYRQQQVPC